MRNCDETKEMHVISTVATIFSLHTRAFIDYFLPGILPGIIVYFLNASPPPAPRL